MMKPQAAPSYRVFYTDFNNPKLLASVTWYRVCPEVGEEILLVDGDFNVVRGRVGRIIKEPDYEQRKSGLISSEADYDSWLDGEEVLTLALQAIKSSEREAITIRTTISEPIGFAAPAGRAARVFTTARRRDRRWLWLRHKDVEIELYRGPVSEWAAEK